MRIIKKTFTIFLVSSNRINNIERTNPIPATSNARQTPTSTTSGNFHESICPDIAQTSASGIIPIKKFNNPAIDVAIGKICGGT